MCKNAAERTGNETMKRQQVNLRDHFTYGKLLRFVAPCIFMMIVTSVYSIVDGFFVSNFAGKNAFAAVNLIMPALMALGAFGFMIGTGGSALVAFVFGEGNKKRGQQIFTMLTKTVVVSGTAVALAGFLFMPQIARMLGASELTFEDSVLYGRIIICSMPFFMLQNSYQSFLVTAQKAHFGLWISIFSGVLNMILDFVLVYVLRWGIWGAAFATAFSQFVGAMIPTVYFMRENKSLLRFVGGKMDWRALGKACANGSSEMLTNLSASLVGMLYNFRLMKLAAEDGVAAYGVIMYVSFIFMAIFFGYSVGINPVIGYHYGAGNREELRNLLKKSLTVTAVAALLMTLSSELLAMPFSQIFVGYDPKLCRMTVTGMQLYSISFLICGFNIFASAFFTGLNNGLVSAVISFLRTLVIQVAAIFILPVFMGINGIWLAIVAAEGVTFAVSVFMLVWGRRQYGY